MAHRVEACHPDPFGTIWISSTEESPSPPSWLLWLSLILGLFWIAGIGSIFALAVGVYALLNASHQSIGRRVLAITTTLVGSIGLLLTLNFSGDRSLH